MKTGTDLSVILTAHDETLVSGPTLAAADAAIALAEADGITVERIITLDNATPQTRAYFTQDRLSHWTKIDAQEGDLGRVRNHIVPQTRGRYIAFLDADDLFSENWLRDGVRRLRALDKQGYRAIAHPELNWLFDGAQAVFLKPDQDDPLFLPQHFYFMNYYDSLCMAPREAHLEHPYVHRDIPAGLSFQDWQFSIETMAAGWRHVNAPDTIIFKRRRDESLVSQSRARRALVRFQDAMRIDRVTDLAQVAPPRPGLIARLFPPAEAEPEQPPAPAPVPHYGPVFEARIERAQAKRGKVPDDSLYDTVKAEFDHAFYLSQNPDIRALEEVDPVAHYLRAGWREGRDPAPWFGTRAYLTRYPEVAESGENPFVHYLTTGREAGNLAAPFTGLRDLADAYGLPPLEAEAAWRDRYEELRRRLERGALGQEVRKVARFEPLVEQGWAEALAVKVPPFHNDQISSRTGAMLRLQKAAAHTPARFVICVNRARFGGARRVEGHLAHALAAEHGPDAVLVITTDQPGALPASKLPQGVRHVDFADLAPLLRGDPRQRVLAEFLRSLAPEAVFNINSRLMWDMLTPYGTALSASMRLYACLLCNEQTDMGHATGYPLRRFYRHFDQLSGVMTDSDFLTAELCARHMLPETDAAHVVTVPNPVDPGIPVAPRPTSNARPQIFWAGRLDAQKRVDLALGIARALPEADFRIWGETVMGGAPLPPLPDNVTLEGRYDRFADLPLQECDTWLYTSGWDGVPMMLLEVAMTGVPLVGSDVGGTGEVLRDGLARKLPPEATPEAWAEALRAVLAAPDEARKQALTLRETLMSERDARAYRAALHRLLESKP
ncbi:glycosyltransferase [Tropicibacter naphthalenivorans]|uniref:Sugar transferase, PEP-CTERM/EpsH1 system associated n=1 Tax=Tropicibacter naphthalenivorans TaxID=441103 RepID=A0A0P1GKD6_9RHOB|nr:glycosyltransferase [Tropicibacter naphthalenivorans]CUH82631.1 sugar transferase, PEP-CTERM/EpsH1 system associated [Tropicibacter naphthalenivorans]SMD08988.1 Glycosyltransferase involved in cell wall bisynthesis [Tropicibacter naphthalenivorans]